MNNVDVEYSQNILYWTVIAPCQNTAVFFQQHSQMFDILLVLNSDCTMSKYSALFFQQHSQTFDIHLIYNHPRTKSEMNLNISW